MLTPHTPGARGAHAAHSSNLVGATIAGKYRIKRLLGHGGMGAVYKAENTAIGRTVAVKVLHGHLADDGVTLARFQREARAAASVGHPHVVEILDMGVEPSGAPYIVMEYVRGKSLSKALRLEGPFEPTRVADIAGQILDGLGALHSRGVVHRDLKPENVLLTVRHGRSDFVKLFDFGVSTYMQGVQEASHAQELTPSGRTMGTPYYASPEQINGSGGRDPRVDLYAVGVMMFEMLAGHRPFSASNFPDLCKSIINDDPPPMRVFRKDVPQDLEAVVRHSLAKEPDERFADAHDMIRALVPFGARMPADDPEPTDTFTYDLRELQAREELMRAAGKTGDSEPPPSGEAGLPLEMVRGEVPLAMLEFLETTLTEEQFDKVLGSVDDEIEKSVRRGYTPSAWYPEDTLDLLEMADRLVGSGDRKLLADAGRYFSRKVFGARREVLSASVTPELLFSMSTELWQRYFAQGEVKVVKLGRGYGRLEVRNQTRPRLARSIAVVGYLDEALKMSGARDVDVRLTRAAALGDSYDVFEATWSG